MQAVRRFVKKIMRKINFDCLADPKKICNMCMGKPTHQSYIISKVKALEAIKAEASNQLKNVKGILGNLEECYAEAKQISKEMKTLLVNRVGDEFDEMRESLTDKEQEIIFLINPSFSHQETKIGNNSEIKNLDSQVSTLGGLQKHHISRMRTCTNKWGITKLAWILRLLKKNAV